MTLVSPLGSSELTLKSGGLLFWGQVRQRSLLLSQGKCRLRAHIPLGSQIKVQDQKETETVAAPQLQADSRPGTGTIEYAHICMCTHTHYTQGIQLPSQTLNSQSFKAHLTVTRQIIKTRGPPGAGGARL